MHRNNKLGCYIVGKIIVSYLLLRNIIVDKLLVISAVRILSCVEFLVYTNLRIKLLNISFIASV